MSELFVSKQRAQNPKPGELTMNKVKFVERQMEA